MDEMKFCQSCGMPVTGDEMRGTDKDGTKSDCYCIYCYKDGGFLSSYEDIVGYCLEHPENWGENVTREKAEEKIKTFISSLARWKKQ